MSTYRRKSDPRRVVIEVDRAADSSAMVVREGASLVLSFTNGKMPSTMSGVGSDGGIARKSRTVAREEDMAAGAPRVDTFDDGPLGARSRASSPTRPTPSSPAVVAAQQRRYTGHRIDLDLKDAAVHKILRLLADVGHVNIVTADNVTGTVTIRMRNVPWDQALDVGAPGQGPRAWCGRAT